MSVPRKAAALAAGLLLAGAPALAEPAQDAAPRVAAAPEPVRDAAPAPAAPEAPAVAAPAPPPVPADPQAAAVFARLGNPAPLLARLTAKDRDAIQAFYALGAFRPVWIADGAWSPAAQAVAARLAAAGEDGLDPRAYPVPALPADKAGETPPAGPDAARLAALAEADLRLSAAAALYARDARGGRLHLSAISRLITPTLDLPAADAVLAALAGAGPGAGDRLQRYNPSQEGYRALKARLADLRRSAPAVLPAVLPTPGAFGPKLAAGPSLRVGMSDPRVPVLRAHLNLDGRRAGTLDAAPGEPEDYDAAVAAAVARFQRQRGLPGTGVLDAATVAALNAAPAQARTIAEPRPRGDEGALLVNMERWRWVPELGADYVMVNVPEFRLRVVRDGRLRDETRVIVGKTESPTPLFSGMMEYAVVNPSWYVPPSILKDMLARGRTAGYEVVRVNGHVSLRQPPGERNALGFIKFMFPNPHAVYLHDTPNRSLFSASQRAFSHGCVRVDDPFRFADAVLPEAWTQERLKKLIGKGERTVRLDRKLPVHLAYFTAYVDDSGLYRTLPDLYGYDAPMRAALGVPGAAPMAKAKPAAEPARRAAALPAPAAQPRRVVRAAQTPPRRTVRAAQTPPRRTVRAAAAPAPVAEQNPWTQPAPVFRGWW